MPNIANALLPFGIGLLALFSAPVTVVAQEAPIDRTELPIRQPVYPAVTELDARNVKAPPFFEVKAPEGAPNVLIVLLDDMGFGQSSAFGGPVHMPTVEALANEGLRFNELHTTALCSPTRAALLTGRNQHISNMGAITELATAFQGNTGVRPARSELNVALTSRNIVMFGRATLCQEF